MNAHLVLAVIAALVLWVGWLYWRPFGPCPKCKGTEAELQRLKDEAADDT